MSQKKILIVDDDTDYQFVLQKSLGREGFACQGVLSVEAALESVRLNLPDVVILDLGLRKASGIAFLQNFAKMISNGEKIPPVVVVSAHTDPEIIDLVKTLGASQFIAKPVDSCQIVSAVHSFFH